MQKTEGVEQQQQQQKEKNIEIQAIQIYQKVKLLLFFLNKKATHVSPFNRRVDRSLRTNSQNPCL